MQAELTIEPCHLPTDKAVELFRQTGCLAIRNFLPAATIEALSRRIDRVLANGSPEGAYITVGNDRQMFPVPIDGVCDDEAIYAPESLRELLAELLGPKFVINCFTCVNAAPGAPDQHLHRDYDGLFQDKVDSFCPPFAVNLFIPLVEMNERNGTTRFWPGSHRRPDTSETPDPGKAIDPRLSPGDALLLDYRVMHHGTANRSSRNRPILCLAYSRDWFLDTRHYGGMNPLQIDEASLQGRDADVQQLFSRASIWRRPSGL